MKPAFLRWNGGSSRDAHKHPGQVRATLRTGRKGHGWLVAEFWYMPERKGDHDKTLRFFEQVAQENGLTIVGTDEDQEDEPCR